ncbi:MAG: amidohydrolase [Bacteroidota bacterium]
MKEKLHITLLQTSLHWEHPTANLDLFDEMIFSCSETDIILLPEMFTTGFTMNALALSEKNDGMVVEWMKIMSHKKKSAICGSIIVEENGKYFNRLFWVQPDGKVFSYDKRHLFRMAEEDKTYSPGTKRLIVEYKGWRICPLVCYDLRFPAWSRNRKLKTDENHCSVSSPDSTVYDLLLYVANWPAARNKPWKTLLEARAIENQCFVAGVNRIGEDARPVDHSGDSRVVDFKGEIIAEANPGETTVVTASLSYRQLAEFREKFPAWRDADEFQII